MLQSCYTMNIASNIPSRIRKNILEDYLLVMISNSSAGLVRSFYLNNIESILETVMITQLHGTEIERIEMMAMKIVGLKLLATLYAKCPKEVVHSTNYTITEKAFRFLKDHRELHTDSVYNGKEMSQFLVKRLKKMRSEVIDGSVVVKEQFRICQCEAFNTMMSIISCIQDQEKFYNAFIFKEDLGSSELIWERIVDLGQEMNFPLEMEDVAQLRRKVVAIRKLGDSSGEGLNENKIRSRDDHYLSDSSLSQDVTTFDFHDSFSSVQLASQAQEKGRETLNGNLLFDNLLFIEKSSLKC